MADLRSRLLEFALSFPETFVDHPWDEEVVKVRKKVFVFFGGPRSSLMTVKLDESHGHALSIDGAEPTRYGLGKSGWVNVPLDGASEAVLRDWIEESYRIVAPKRLVAELDGRNSANSENFSAPRGHLDMSRLDTSA